MNENVRLARLEWTGRGMEFTGGAPGSTAPVVHVDGDGLAGTSPMVLLLLAAAGCAGSDVVSILEKMRVRLARCLIEVRGVRRGDVPRRYVALHFTFRLSGAGVDRGKAERAVRLSMEKYCSVIHSLARDIEVTHEIEIDTP